MRTGKVRNRIEGVMLLQVPRKDYLEYKKIRKPWTIVKKKRTESTVELTYRVPAGYSFEDIEKHIDALQASVDSLINLEKEGLGGVRIVVVTKDFPTLIPENRENVEEWFQELSKEHNQNNNLILGFDVLSVPRIHNLRVPHMIIAGMSGYGKTDVLRFLVWQLIKMYGEHVRITVIDGKGFSFIPFRNIPQVKVIRDFDKACGEIERVYKEQTKRSNIVWNTGKRDSVKSFPWEFLIIDEGAQFAPSQIRDPDRKDAAIEADTNLAKIAQVGREAKVGLWYCTQRPDATIVNPLVKAVCDISICFRTKTESNSIIVMDRPGAEDLPQGTPGRAIVSATVDTMIQVPYLGDDGAWEKILQPFYREVKVDERTEKGTIVDGVENLASLLHQSNWENVLGEQPTEQEGTRSVEGVAGREASDESRPGIQTYGVAVDEEGEGRGERQKESEKPHRKLRAYVGRWRSVLRVVATRNRVTVFCNRIADRVRKQTFRS